MYFIIINNDNNKVTLQFGTDEERSNNVATIESRNCWDEIQVEIEIEERINTIKDRHFLTN